MFVPFPSDREFTANNGLITRQSASKTKPAGAYGIRTANCPPPIPKALAHRRATDANCSRRQKAGKLAQIQFKMQITPRKLSQLKVEVIRFASEWAPRWHQEPAAERRTLPTFWAVIYPSTPVG